MTELLANNSAGLQDEDGERSNWLELYNASGAPVSLDGWFLTDTTNNLAKWRFPAVTLNAGAYLVVFASGKDRTNAAAPLHANFKLDAAGEYLGLVRPNLSVAHEFAPLFPPQSKDVSYGLSRGTGGAAYQYDPNSRRYFAPPTPGATNGFGVAGGVVADTKFSVNRGFFETNFILSITSATPGAEIYYTLDGSVPNDGRNGQPRKGILYSSPISITTTRTVRAAAFKPDYVPTDVDTQTYLFLGDVIRQPSKPAGFPLSWGPSRVDYAMDQTVVNANLGTIIDDLKSLPTISLVTDLAHWFSAATGIFANTGGLGEAWERPVSVEYFDPKQPDRVFQINAGVALEGSSTRNYNNPKHNLRLYFTRAYAGDLEFPLYSDSTADRFERLTLLSGGHDGPMAHPSHAGPATYARDRFLHKSLLDMGGSAPTADAVHVYINGLYWGHYWLTERPDHAFAAEHFGGSEEDYDAIKHMTGTDNNYEVISGDAVAWNQMFSLARAGLTSSAKYAAIQQLLEVQSFADYLIVNMHSGNDDWPKKNWYATRKREPGAGFRFHTWDGDFSLGLISTTTDRTGVNNPNTPGELYAALRANAEFRLLFADRIQKHLFNDGAMTVQAMQDRFQAIADQIDAAMVPLCARFGDNFYYEPDGNPANDFVYTREGTWRPEVNRILNQVIPQRFPVSLAQFRAAGLYPALGAPDFNQFGGSVPAGFSLTLGQTNASGTIFFTLDGSDPRVYGSGAVALRAQAYSLPVTLNTTTLVRARVKNGTMWSALVEATFYTSQDFTRLLVTEIMYDPPAFGAVDGGEVEFLELKNAGTSTLNLSGLSFTAGISFTFTNGTLLGPGQFFVLGRNRAQLQAKYPGLVVGGVYTGKLNNGSETLSLAHPFGGKVLSVTYDTVAPWPVTPHGFGFSLVSREPNSNPDPDNGGNWRASSSVGGSPGADDPAPGFAPILINEVLTASAALDPDAIELFNPGAAGVNLGGWFLTDDPAVPEKFRIPDGTMIPALGFRVFTEADFNPTPGTNGSFALSSRGESVYLFSADSRTNLSGYSHGFSFGAAAAGVTFGRDVISTGEEQFPAQISPTLGASNAGPRVGPVVITEIHYHPEAGGDEFIELKNLTGAPVPLYDPAYRTNTWKLNGIGFTFPTDVMLGSHGFLLLVATNPVNFRAKYSVPEDVPILGPWSGVLQDSGERLELQRPDSPDTNGLGFITVDEVRYNDKAPWPPAADGSGPSLQRLFEAAYGNDPAHWVAATPTPGAPYISGLLPTITAQPLAQTVVAYQPATFNVGAEGPPPLNYQWRFNGDAIPGATGPTLLLSNVQPFQAGSYSAAVFNDAGAVLSVEAPLTVLIPASILSQPRSVTTNAGNTVVFIVSASGSGTLGYQWRFNGIPLATAANALLTLANVQPAHAGVYTVVITDAIGPVESQPATLIVNVRPAIAQQPLSQAAAAGGNVTFGVSATGSLPLSYRWRKNSSGITNIILMSSNCFFTVTNISLTSTGNWSVVVTNPAGQAISANAALTLLTDTDGDGLPDDWLMQYFGHTNALAGDLSRPQDDADGDGMSNRDEYIAGTDPRDPLSYLTTDRLATTGVVTLTFLAVSNRTYTVQYTEALGLAPWQRVRDIMARATNHVETVTDATATNRYRFYRLLTPAVP